jgi:hypothetical protein
MVRESEELSHRDEEGDLQTKALDKSRRMCMVSKSPSAMIP